VARRRAGPLALAADAGTPDNHIGRMHALIKASEWPNRALLITAVDATTGEPQIWDRSSGVPLPAAVAASTAFPGAYPPIPINGRHYIDGGLRSATNADLAVGADTVVVIEPLAHLFPREPFQQQLAATGATTVITVSPDPLAITAFGPDLHDRAAWQPAYQAGPRQAGNAAARLRSAQLFLVTERIPS
jgi:NTE family protein